MAGALPFQVFRQLFFVGASEYFATPLTAAARAIRAGHSGGSRTASLVPAMQAGGFGLRHGKVLVLFPEGERSIDGTVKTFKKGAAILAHHLAAPIVPVAIDGLYAIWPRNRPVSWSRLRPWRRTRVAVRFGAPLPAPGTGCHGPVGWPGRSGRTLVLHHHRAPARGGRCDVATDSRRRRDRIVGTPRWKQLALLHTA